MGRLLVGSNGMEHPYVRRHRMGLRVALAVAAIVVLSGCSDSLDPGRDAARIASDVTAESGVEWTRPQISGLSAFAETESTDATIDAPEGFKVGGFHPSIEGFSTAVGFTGPNPHGDGDCHMSLHRGSGVTRLRVTCDDV